MTREKIVAGRGGGMNHGIGTCHGKAGIVIFFLLACAAVAFWAPNADAQSNYYTQQGCSGCHGATPTTCNGCHHHGPRSDAAATNKTSYAPGEAVTVTFSGGSQSGWIRAILYLNNVEVGRSTGPSHTGGGPGFPITFSTTAPTTPGTYTYQAAWYGNRYDTSTLPATFTPDPNNPNHGEQRVSTNSFTVSAGNVAGPLTVSPAGGLTSSGTAGGPFTPSSLSYTLTNTGTAPMNWSATKVQSWVTLSATGGTLAAGATATVTASINSGANSLTASGTSYTDTVTFTNTSNNTGDTTRPVSLTVNAAEAPTISTVSLPAGAVNTAYSQTLAATGGTTLYSWSVSSGTLPAGLSLSAAGVLSGTPTTVESSSFTVRVAGANSASSSKDFSVTINAAEPVPITLSSDSGGACSVAVRTGSGDSAIDGTLILAGLGLTVWGIRIRRRRG
jgi:hypothetical protein